MNELQRQAYIEAIGVDSYFPRFTLPGAAVSVLSELPFELEDETAIASVTTEVVSELAPVSTVPQPARSGSAANGSAAAMQALFDNNDKSTVKKLSPNVAVQNNAEQLANNAVSIPHFSLSIIRGANVLVVDEGLQGDVDQTEYLTLIHNMLFALGAQTEKLSIEQFNWPMVKSAKFDQTELAAKQTLQAFMAKQLSQIESGYLLLMGDSARQYLASQVSSDEGDDIAHGRFVTCETLDAQLLCTHSAAQMLKAPELKRQVWQDLQPLYRVLKKH